MKALILTTSGVGRLLAIDVAMNHGPSLRVSGLPIIDFGKGVFVKITDRVLQKVTKEHVSVRVNKHGPEPNIAIRAGFRQKRPAKAATDAIDP